jgi:hypothetical protein
MGAGHARESTLASANLRRESSRSAMSIEIPRLHTGPGVIR